jgi:hypothetical protein
MGKEQQVAKVFGTSCVFIILLDMFLIPPYGATGAAAIAVIVNYALGLSYLGIYSWNVHVEERSPSL